MKDLFRRLARPVRNVFLASVALIGSAQLASAQVTLPDTGVDVTGHVTAAITAMGAIVAVVIGGFFAFMLIRKALQWGRRAV